MKRILSFILLSVLASGMCACNLKNDLSRIPDDSAGKKLAVIFPGMGYTKDRPLLYHSREILEKEGYEIRYIEWNDLPKNMFTEPACTQAAEQLDDMDLDGYEDIIFVSKSIGTVASSTYVAEHDLDIRQIWYTPLLEAFDACGGEVENGSIIAFIGTDDERSNVSQVRIKANTLEIELHMYEDCGHSLERDDDAGTQEVLDDVMKSTSEYIALNN